VALPITKQEANVIMNEKQNYFTGEIFASFATYSKGLPQHQLKPPKTPVNFVKFLGFLMRVSQSQDVIQGCSLAKAPCYFRSLVTFDEAFNIVTHV
jgi:hypothetical protein